MSKILVVEDEAALADVLRKKLQTEGYEVSLAADGASGLAAMRNWRPDLVLLDIVLPKMDGYQVLEARDKDNILKAIPVIVISNSGQPVEIDRALALGVKDYLVKAQFSPDEVMEKVHKYIPSPHAAPAGASAPSRGGGKVILIVEDDDFLRELAVKKFKAAGHTVEFAVDGETAVPRAKELRPDAILLDIVLPGIDGFEVLRVLKEDPETKHIPVILLSNLGQHDEVDRGKRLGADDFLIKAHYTLDEIIEKVEGVCRAPRRGQ